MITTLRMCLSAAAILAGASLAIADEQPAPATPAATPATDATAADEQRADPSDPNTIICKRQAMTGTRVGKYHICMTRKEWDEMARRGADETSKLQRDGDFGKQRRGPK